LPIRVTAIEVTVAGHHDQIDGASSCGEPVGQRQGSLPGATAKAMDEYGDSQSVICL
jgi:hypothetical protein